jgi:UDP-N-acetylmuramoyl-tripeptide--D-alanyl-D-alanine ligase
MVQPHIALINNVGSAHIGYFQSKKDIIKAKIEIIEGITSNGKLIINDDINLSIHLKKNLENRNIEVLRFGYKKNSDLILKKYQFSPKSSKIEALINQLNLSFTLNAPGEHMAMNSIAVLGISISLSVDTDKVIRSLSGFEAIKGRGMIYNLSIKGNFFKAIDESYNANPESTKASIKLLSEIDYLKSKRKILVLGDMMELGTFSKVIHIEMASFINNSEVDLVFCTGYEMKNLWENLNESKKGFYSNQSEMLIKSLNDKIRENDLILFKGSSKSGVKIVLDTFKEEKLKRNIA